MSDIHVVALLYPAKGKLERFNELMKGMTRAVHEKEPGARRFLMTTQANSEEPTIILIENYKNQQVAQAHTETEHFKRLFATFEQEGIFSKPFEAFFTTSTFGFDTDRNLL